MNFRSLWLLTLILVSIACSSEKADQNTSKRDAVVSDVNETELMAKELSNLVKNGNPNLYYHWNLRQAQLLKNQLNIGSEQQKVQTWYNYSSQLLNAGESRQAIQEIEKVLSSVNAPYDQIISEQNLYIFDLLALAYLRLGEQENCQNNHTPFACILPLKSPAIHELREGSEKAIELYSMILDKFPKDKYKWLLNLAYMTLGEHPQKVPKKYLIRFPNWQLEQQNFPSFKEIAMNLGVAVNGLSGGTCVEDFNNDGFLDIFATSYGMEDQVKLFLHDGKGGYTDATEQSGLTGIVSGLNTIHADYNNDGFNDILILRGGWLGQGGSHPNSLLKNNGDGTFTDVTRSSKLLSYHPTQTAAWADFNRDGFLDLFIGNESNAASPHPSELFKNNGDGTFTEVSKEYGLGSVQNFIKGVTWGDINNDKWPDLFVSVLGGQNLLFKNVEGRFVDVSSSAGIQEPIFSFPCWFWDVNQDGLQDMFVSGYDTRNLGGLADDYARELQNLEVETSKPRLFINNGDETFREAASEFGISKTMYSMGANFGDLDNDGFLDFYVGTGSPDFSTVVPNRMFRNTGNNGFEEVTSAGNFGHIQKGHGIAFADMDRDGDQDIYAVMGGAYEGDVFTNVLYENPSLENNWITIELEGVKTNRSAIGSTIELELEDDRKLYHTIGTGGSFGSSSLQAEIGLGKAGMIKTLSVHWQNSDVETFSNVEVNQKVRIKEGSNKLTKVPQAYIPFNAGQTEHQGH